MKKLECNKNKLTKLLKRGIVLVALTSSVTLLSGCTEDKTPSNWPSEYSYIDQSYNYFDEYHKTIIKDGVPVNVYIGENISLTIDKTTYEVKEYIYSESLIIGKIYDINTGYLLVDANILEIEGRDNWEKISQNKYIINFVDIADYVEGETLKEYYTLEEIKELEPKIVESLKLIEEYNGTKQKIK